jgi:predicted GNAT family N-acyltransferase
MNGMPELTLKVKTVAYGSLEYLEALELRRKVLREPLGLSYSATDLDLERNDVHFIATQNQQIVGCLLLRPMTKPLIKMRQVAVDTAQQKRGVGQNLVLAAEDYAHKNGFLNIELSSRAIAVPFYQKLGYQTTGQPYVEVTLPHQKMEKSL